MHAQCVMYLIYMHTSAFEVWLHWDIKHYICQVYVDAHFQLQGSAQSSSSCGRT